MILFILNNKKAKMRLWLIFLLWMMITCAEAIKTDPLIEISSVDGINWVQEEIWKIWFIPYMIEIHQQIFRIHYYLRDTILIKLLDDILQTMNTDVPYLYLAQFYDQLRLNRIEYERCEYFHFRIRFYHVCNFLFLYDPFDPKKMMKDMLIGLILFISKIIQSCAQYINGIESAILRKELKSFLKRKFHKILNVINLIANNLVIRKFDIRIIRELLEKNFLNQSFSKIFEICLETIDFESIKEQIYPDITSSSIKLNSIQIMEMQNQIKNIILTITEKLDYGIFDEILDLIYDFSTNFDETNLLNNSIILKLFNPQDGSRNTTMSSDRYITPSILYKLIKLIATLYSIDQIEQIPTE